MIREDLIKYYKCYIEISDLIDNICHDWKDILDKFNIVYDSAYVAEDRILVFSSRIVFHLTIDNILSDDIISKLENNAYCVFLDYHQNGKWYHYTFESKYNIAQDYDVESSWLKD